MLDILYQDNHLLCLEKPGGLLTQPSGTELDSLESQAKAWLKQEFQKPGAVFLEAVHRIDRPVCGVVLFARTSKALSRLNASIRSGECVKEYHALVERAPRQDSGTLTDWLVHDSHCARVVPAGTPGAREATLEWRTMERRKDGSALLHILLGTGRYHQIRAQLAYAGMPILGDRKYGATKPYRQDCIGLQHYRLTIQHPVTRAKMVFTSRHPL
ncbi:MAG: RluA family pseudouridine synthase [Victivallales bacterium]|nr:RluA family pseudouridine synthase [Victivallales bacterium]